MEMHFAWGEGGAVLSQPGSPKPPRDAPVFRHGEESGHGVFDLLVATSDGIRTFERNANQSMLAELVGAVRGGVIPAKALSQAFLASIPKATYLCLFSFQ